MNELRKLNFGNLISVGDNPAAYSFTEYRDNEEEHRPIKDYCVRCEMNGCGTSRGDKSYKLTNISHGAHSSDFFLALGEEPEPSNWHQKPIMFVYESPSKDYGIYKEDVQSCNRYNKHPSKKWYWIHGAQQRESYPNGFNRGEYSLGWSAALTFKLAKVYMTNLVKCGLNNAEGKFKGLASFKEKTVVNCFENFLKKEISIIEPKIIFAMGSKVEHWVNQLVNEQQFDFDFLVQQLPHPAALSFRSEHVRTIYFWHIARTLLKAEIINNDEAIELANLYLEEV